MKKYILFAVLTAIAVCGQAQTIEVTNTINDVAYVFSGKGFADAKSTEGTPFVIISKEPSQSHLNVMDELCYDFDELPFPVGVLAFVTIIDRQTGQQRWEYWRSFDKGEHSLCITATTDVKISLVKDPKNSK